MPRPEPPSGSLIPRSDRDGMPRSRGEAHGESPLALLQGSARNTPETDSTQKKTPGTSLRRTGSICDRSGPEEPVPD